MTTRKPLKRDQWVRFSVAGYGEFPIDMLRYDRCWPDREDRDSVRIAGSFSRSNDLAPRVVTLVGANYPTDGRWKSFNWPVDPDSIQVIG